MSEQNSSSSAKAVLVETARQELVGTALRRNPAVGVAAAILLPMLRFIARTASQVAKPAPKRGRPSTKSQGKLKEPSRKHQGVRPALKAAASRGKSVPRDLSIRSVQTATVSINRNEKGGL